MKKYFVKYLPVKGEIKEAEVKDTWLITPKGLATFELRVHKDINTPTNKIRVHNGKTYVDFLETELKIAKLFLCSKDIQVGDKVMSDFIRWKIVKNLHEALNKNQISLQEAKAKNFFKVIGEISPKAIWIKEGDEFDDMDWAQFLTYWDMDENGECNPKELDEEELEWKIDYGYQYEPYIRVKCSQCEIYH
jgi:hypothetical protein